MCEKRGLANPFALWRGRCGLLLALLSLGGFVLFSPLNDSAAP
jgi:hypothetical protein